MNAKFSCGASHQNKGKCLAKIASSVVLAGALLVGFAQNALAIGGPSGAKLTYKAQGKIGEVVVKT